MMLAEAAVGGVPVGIAAWLGCLAFVVMLVNGILKLVDRTKVRPEPSMTYATKADMDKHAQENRKEHENLFAKIGGVERGLRDDVKTDLSQVHEKINAVAREVSSLTTATDLQTAQLVRIEGNQDKRLNQIESKLDQTIRDQGKGRH
jgi:hypothetical protein